MGYKHSSHVSRVACVKYGSRFATNEHVNIFTVLKYVYENNNK